MFEKEELKIYLYTKFLQSYLYDNEICAAVERGDYDSYVFDSSFLCVLINYIMIYANNTYADLDIKNNIYTLINYIRFKNHYPDADTKKYFYNIFNDLILKLNTMSNEKSKEIWVVGEFIIRKDIKPNKQISYEEYKEYEKFVKISIAYDFILLTYLSDKVDEKKFDDNIEAMANDEFFFASLNAIIKQCPELLRFPIFKRRVKKVIDYNRKHMNILRDDSLENKIFVIKQNNKYYKNLKKA